MSDTGSVPAGTRVGRYEIVSLLGRGGMGEVYTARDSNLGRDVALKILPGNRTSDPDRVARFVREARASSALNHPSIVSVHDAGSDGSIHFLAMELIDGKPLSKWMRSRQSPSTAIELMAQVAEGLARAHANGIVHRDLKPDNIMVSSDGYAKILDFGVAKLTERLGPQGGHSGVTTPTSRVGTTAYMSPEQIEGRAVDLRADVFAFGIVLYELITGRNPFAAGQYADTLYNIAHLEPPLEAIPTHLRRIIARCLRKDPDQRYHSMKDVSLDLREVLNERQQKRSARARWIALAAAVVIAAATIWLAIRDRESQAPAANVAAPIMTRLTNSGKVQAAAISPDGNYLVHDVKEGEQHALYVRQIATGTVTRIAPPRNVFYYQLRVSPDGNYVYYCFGDRSEPNVAHIEQIPLLGGSPRRIANDTEFDFSVSPDGTQIAFIRFNALDREFRLTTAAIDGSGEQIVLRSRYPHFIGGAVWEPGNRSITYVLGDSRTISARAFHRLDLATRSSTPIPMPAFPGIGSYAWLPDGSGALLTVFNREEPPQIWYVPAGDTTGRKVTSEVSAYYSVNPTADSQSFVTVRDTTDANIAIIDLANPKRLRPLTSGVGNIFGGGGVRWLNERRILYTGMSGGMNTFFAGDISGTPPVRLIHNMRLWNPAVSLDGSRIAFISDKSGNQQVWIAGADGSNPRQLTRGDRAISPSFTPDGRSIVFMTVGESQFAWKVDIDGKSKPVQLTSVPTNKGVVSPDGKWLLCRLRSRQPDEGPLWRTSIVALDGSGRTRAFDVPRHGGPPQLRWHPNGESFLFVDWKEGVANVWIQDLEGGEPRLVTEFDSGEIFSFDISRDGKRLVFSRGENTADAVLVRNFR